MLPKTEKTRLSNFEVKGQGFQHTQLCNSIPAYASLKRKSNTKNYWYPVTQWSDQMALNTSSVQHHGLKSDWDTEKVNCSFGLHCCLLGQLPYPFGNVLGNKPERAAAGAEVPIVSSGEKSNKLLCHFYQQLWRRGTLISCPEREAVFCCPYAFCKGSCDTS